MLDQCCTALAWLLTITKCLMRTKTWKRHCNLTYHDITHFWQRSAAARGEKPQQESSIAIQAGGWVDYNRLSVTKKSFDRNSESCYSNNETGTVIESESESERTDWRLLFLLLLLSHHCYVAHIHPINRGKHCSLAQARSLSRAISICQISKEWGWYISFQNSLVPFVFLQNGD